MRHPVFNPQCHRHPLHQVGLIAATCRREWHSPTISTLKHEFTLPSEVATSYCCAVPLRAAPNGIGCELLAVDGTRLEAVNNKDRNSPVRRWQSLLNWPTRSPTTASSASTTAM